MRLISQSFVWNSSQFFSAPIMSVHNYVDEVQVFDGAFKFMSQAGYAKVPWSTDGTKEVFLALQLKCDKKWVPCTDFYDNEVAKKMFMQQDQFWKPGEWKYILSDDEVPAGDIKSAFGRVRKAEKALVGYVPMVELKRTKNVPNVTLEYLGYKPRFLKWQKGLHWQGKHFQLFNGSGQPRESWPKIVLSEMVLVHLKYLRFDERLEMQLAYEKLDL